MRDYISEFKAREFSAPVENEIFDGCGWAERIPKFYRGETDAVTNEFIQEHLKTCEECNLLLAALAVQTPPKPILNWIKQGLTHMCENVVSFLGEGTFDEGPAVVTRSGKRELLYLTEHQIELPNGNILCLHVIKQDEQTIVSAFMQNSDECGFDLSDVSNKILKSTDSTKIFKFEMPKENYTLTINSNHGIYIVSFEGGEL